MTFSNVFGHMADGIGFVLRGIGYTIITPFILMIILFDMLPDPFDGAAYSLNGGGPDD